MSLFTATEADVIRVNRGYNWLTTYGHGYGLDISRIDPATIEVADPSRCPLAQASGGNFGSFGTGMSLANRSGNLRWALSHGFWAALNDYGPAGSALAYHGGNLDAIWRQLLTPAPVLAAVA